MHRETKKAPGVPGLFKVLKMSSRLLKNSGRNE